MKKYILHTILVLLFHTAYSQQISFYDNINFEDSCDYLYFGSTEPNLWQIGKPSKIIFDSAKSIPYAIVTDTVNYYMPENHSYFILKLPPGFDHANTTITFWHKFDTDNMNDYGVVEVSYDEGDSWNILATDPSYYLFYTRFYGSGSSNYLATGNSNGWNYDEILYFFYLAPYPDNLWLRYSFYSDSIHNEREGWMIDNIEITYTFFNSIEEKSNFSSKPYPNPCKDYITIYLPDHNSKEIVLRIYDLHGKNICSKRFENDRIRIKTSDYNCGLYVYYIHNSDNSTICQGKFIVNK